MNFIKNNLKAGSFLLGAAMIMLTACNKEVEEIPGSPTLSAPYTPPMVFSATAKTLGDSLAGRQGDSLFYRLVERGGLLPMLNTRANTFTMFLPSATTFKLFLSAISGIPVGSPDALYSGFIRTTLPVQNAKSIAEYHIIPQAVPASKIPATFPNFPYPTMLNPAPTLSTLARLDAYLSRRTQGAWKDNVPIVTPDIITGNGFIHVIAAPTPPPTELLLTRINNDTELTFLKAAILRADSGQTATTVGSLQYFLGDQGISLGANFTVFAPTDAAFRTTLYAAAFPAVRAQIFQQAYNAAITSGQTPAQATIIANAAADAAAPAQTTALVSTPLVFTTPALYPFLTAQTVKGILFYHMMGMRVFSVNIPTGATLVNSLLDGSNVPPPFGLTAAATFTGPSVTSATVKGKFNATASNILINPTPVTGSSDQRYVNGVLHKIDQVLLPASL